MPDNLPIVGRRKQGHQPPDGGGVVMIACDIPAEWAEQIHAQKLVPRVLIFEQVSGSLTAGAPVNLPVRELSPMDVLVMAQRAIQSGHIVPAIAFQIAEAPAAKPPKLT